jgi:hypothetical protein
MGIVLRDGRIACHLLSSSPGLGGGRPALQEYRELEREARTFSGLGLY